MRRKVLKPLFSDASCHAENTFTNTSINDDEMFNDCKDEDNHSFEGYEYVEPNICKLLNMEPPAFYSSFNESLIDPSTLCINWKEWKTFQESFTHKNTFHPILYLAKKCDVALFPTNIGPAWIHHLSHQVSLPKPLVALLTPILLFPKTSPPHNTIEIHIYIATQLSLLMLESNIRNLTSKKNGKAPLLKDMIEEIGTITPPQYDNETVLKDNTNSHLDFVGILRVLLLPQEGNLNLRNLIWHGFLSKVDRKWLSLTILLSLSLQNQFGMEYESNDSVVSLKPDIKDPLLTKDIPIIDLSSYPPFGPVIQYGRSILEKSHLENLYEKLTLAPQQYFNLSKPSISSNPNPFISSSKSLIPKSHHAILKYVLDNYSTSNPACFMAILTPILEHSLRLLWCRVNSRPKDEIARSGNYYVTLDGIGQKDKHDVMVNAYLSSCNDTTEDVQQKPNQLINVLDRDCFSLLLDLYASPTGPNIRSTVAHGIWNDYLWREIMRLYIRKTENDRDFMILSKEEELLMNNVYSLLTLLDSLADRFQYYHQNNLNDSSFRSDLSKSFEALRQYQPVFSYSGKIHMHIDNLMKGLHEVSNWTMRPTENIMHSSKASTLNILCISMDELESMKQRVVALDLIDECDHLNETLVWNISKVLQEFERNILFSTCGVASCLLAEVDQAVSDYVQLLEDGHQLLYASTQSLENHSLSRKAKERKIRQWKRMWSLAPVTLEFYSVCAFMALRTLEYKMNVDHSSQTPSMNMECQDKDMIFWTKIVERSRMCLSTYAKYVTLNQDRAIRAISLYNQSKLVKAIIAERQK